MFSRSVYSIQYTEHFSFWFSSNLNNSFTTTSVYIFQVSTLVWFVSFFISLEFSHFDYFIYCVSVQISNYYHWYAVYRGPFNFACENGECMKAYVFACVRFKYSISKICKSSVMISKLCYKAF